MEWVLPICLIAIAIVLAIQAAWAFWMAISINRDLNFKRGQTDMRWWRNLW